MNPVEEIPSQGMDTAVILAAGRGSRMGRPFSSRPKAMLGVGGLSILEHQLSFLRQRGFRKCLIVHSPLWGVFENLQSHGLELGWVEQTEANGIANALLQVQGAVSSPFLLLLGDIFFTPFDLWKAARGSLEKDWDAILLSRNHCSPAEVKKNFSIEADPDGRVRSVREKPFSVQPLDKGIGIYFLKPSIFTFLLEAQLAGELNCLTLCLQRMVDSGANVWNCPVPTHDVNVTTPSDLITSRWLSICENPSDGPEVYGLS